MTKGLGSGIHTHRDTIELCDLKLTKFVALLEIFFLGDIVSLYKLSLIQISVQLKL